MGRTSRARGRGFLGDSLRRLRRSGGSWLVSSSLGRCRGGSGVGFGGRFLFLAAGAVSFFGGATLGAGLNCVDPFFAFVFGGAGKFTVLFLLFISRKFDPEIVLLGIASGGFNSD
jgi:hypothetical protein